MNKEVKRVNDIYIELEKQGFNPGSFVVGFSMDKFFIYWLDSSYKDKKPFKKIYDKYVEYSFIGPITPV